jgi:hypothetical protein
VHLFDVVITATARLTIVWVVLWALTIASWFSGHTDPGRELTPNVPITITVPAIGFVKTRLVIHHVMEVRTAALCLRRCTDAWLRPDGKRY